MNDDIKQLIYSNPHAYSLVQMLIRCGGFYLAQHDVYGITLGPYVRYADKIHCGPIYIDIGMLEIFMPKQITSLAINWNRTYYDQVMALRPDAVLSVPSGGNDFGKDLAAELGLMRLCAQKLITKASDGQTRSESEFVLDRHNLSLEGLNIITAEDIVNNKASSAAVAKLASRHGAQVVANACIWERSVVETVGPPTFPLIKIPLSQIEVVKAEQLGIELITARSNRARIKKLMEQYPF